MKTLQPENITLPICLAEDSNERAFLRSFLKPGMTFWDIGACYGLYTGPASKLVSGIVGKEQLEGEVLSFEPSPDAYLLLLQTIELNHLTNVTPSQVAVSDKLGEVIFHTSSRVNHGSMGNPHEGAKEGKEIRVQSVTIDSLIASGHKSPHLIKIDANGAEPLVLAGGKGLWRSKNPPTLICKFNKRYKIAPGSDFLLPSSDECFLELPSNYRWFKINGQGELEGPMDVKADKEKQEGKGHRNLVARPQ